MEAAFLVEVIPPTDRRPAYRPGLVDAFGCGFEPLWTKAWETETGGGRRISVVAWGGAAADGAWSELDGGVVGLVGHVRRRGQPWSPPDRRAADLALLGHEPPASTLHDDLVGIYSAISVSADGTGWLAGDACGFRCTYRAERDGRLIISSRAALAAAARCSPAPPTRDTESGAWVGSLSYHVGSRTGFEGVSVIDPGTILRLDHAEPSWQSTENVFATDVPERSIDDAAGHLVEDLAESLRATLEFPARRRIINLTGGKDSRLILAAAISAGIHREFEYETFGPPDLGDVVIAGQIAEELGLRHDVRFIGLRSPVPYDERVRAFVERTCGMTNAWDASTPNHEDEVRITGLGGEALRSFEKLLPGPPLDEMFEKAFPVRTFRRLGLRSDEAADDLRRALRRRIDAEVPEGTSAFDRMTSYFVHHKNRFARCGPREEVSGSITRTQPLYSTRAIGIARSVSELDRAHGVLGAEVMRRSSAYLVNLPFTSGGWSPRAQDHLASRGPGPSLPSVGTRVGGSPREPVAPAAPRATDEPRNVGESLVQRFFARGPDERLELVKHAVRAAPDESWGRLRAPALTAALDRWGELGVADRRAIFGAATGLLWASGAG